jgi:hypothetical protein
MVSETTLGYGPLPMDNGRTSARLLPLALLALGGLVPVLSGCPANACFLEICEGRNCRCSISSCTEGAEFDTKRRRCRCTRGYYDIAGQCLDQAQANAFCGIGYAWGRNNSGRDGCVKLHCRPGDTMDERTGWCVPRDQVAQQTGVQIGQGQKLGCAAGEVFVLNAGQAACVPAAQSCAKDEIWNGAACQKMGACGTGETFDPALGRCVPYASGGGDRGVVVNVQQWAYSTYGPPNAPGTPAFCASFAKKPLSFGVGPGGSALVRVTVNLSFPGGEVAKGEARSTTVYDVNGNPVAAAGASEVQTSVMSMFQPLVNGGGRASSPTATTTVKCPVINGSKPVIVPEEQGGF